MSARPPYEILVDATGEHPPDEETVIVHYDDGRSERLRVQDYRRVYAVPGLYEAIVVDKLKCRSPERVALLLASVARALGRAPETVRVLDLGAGNGVSGQALSARGLTPVVGLDIEPGARAAAIRDRPHTYQRYLTADLLALTPAQARAIRALEPNALACVGAIGLNHVPPASVAAALELLDGDSLLAYTLAATPSSADAAELAARLQAIADRWLIEQLARQRYRHRFTVTGRPIWWEAVVLRARRL